MNLPFLSVATIHVAHIPFLTASQKLFSQVLLVFVFPMLPRKYQYKQWFQILCFHHCVQSVASTEGILKIVFGGRFFFDNMAFEV